MGNPERAGPVEAKKPPRRKTLFTLILLLLMFAVLEVGARALFAFFVGPRTFMYGTAAYRDARTIPSAVMKQVGYTPPSPSHPVASYEKFAPHEVKYDHDEKGERFSPSINSRGFRGPEFVDAKEPGVIRVVTLGESSTFGYHDRDDETYPHYLQQILNESSAGKQRYEVINLGIPHINSEQIVSLFIAEALPLQPDVITLYAGWNDSGREVLDVVDRRKNLSRLYEGLRSKLLTVAILDSLLYYAGGQHYTPEDLQNLAGAQQFFIEHVEAIHKECLKRGILFIPATQQSDSQMVPREQMHGLTYEQEAAQMRKQLESEGLPRRAISFMVHHGVMQALRQWADREHVMLVDEIAALDQDRDDLLTYVHLNAAGNRVVAKELGKAIQEQLEARDASHEPEPASAP
jgi:lysophospholipase L1-like esterase